MVGCQDVRTVAWHGSALTVLYLLVGGIWLMLSNRWTFTDTVYFMVSYGEGLE